MTLPWRVFPIRFFPPGFSTRKCYAAHEYFPGDKVATFLFEAYPGLDARVAKRLAAVNGSHLLEVAGAAVDTTARAPGVLGIKDSAYPANRVIDVIPRLCQGLTCFFSGDSLLEPLQYFCCTHSIHPCLRLQGFECESPAVLAFISLVFTSSGN